MQIKDIMSKSVITVKRGTTLKQLLAVFTKFHIFPLVPVVREDNQLEGIVSFRNLISVFQSTQSDILKTVAFLDEKEEDIFKADLPEELGKLVVVDDIMEKRFVVIYEDSSLEEAYNLMRLHLKDEFPVVDKEGKLAGMVGIFDIIQQLFREKGIIE